MELKIPALEQLVDHVASGIGSIAGTILANWRAGKEAEAKLTLARSDAEARTIDAKSHAQTLSIITDAQAEARNKLDVDIESGQMTAGITREDISASMRFQAHKRINNVKTVVEQTADELVDRNVTKHEPDHDWTARFFDSVQDVSSTELQRIWAKILAGEVQRPGTTSIKTLNVLHQLDKSAADTFQRLCAMSISIRIEGRYIAGPMVADLGKRAANNALSPYALNYEALNQLNEYGLIVPEYTVNWDFRMCRTRAIPNASSGFATPLVFGGHYWVLMSTKEVDLQAPLNLTGVSLSISGRELSYVVEPPPVPIYTRKLTEYFKSRGLEMKEIDPRILARLTQAPPS